MTQFHLDITSWRKILEPAFQKADSYCNLFLVADGIQTSLLKDWTYSIPKLLENTLAREPDRKMR